MAASTSRRTWRRASRRGSRGSKLAVRLAEERGVDVHFENHNAEPEHAEIHYIPHTVAETRRFFDAVSSPRLRWACNIGHALLVPDRFEGFLEAFGADRIGHVRLHDTNGLWEEHFLPGEGIVDFRASFATLTERGYQGPFTLDFGTPEQRAHWRDGFAALLDEVQPAGSDQRASGAAGDLPSPQPTRSGRGNCGWASGSPLLGGDVRVDVGAPAGVSCGDRVGERPCASGRRSQLWSSASSTSSPAARGRATPTAFAESFELVDAAEQWGLDVMWLAELHISPRSVLASPMASPPPSPPAPKRLKIGTAVQVLPLGHPLRLAEEAATSTRSAGAG